jgi:hypothetical protein
MQTGVDVILLLPTKNLNSLKFVDHQENTLVAA